jgi:hypothetical protein
MTRPNPSEYHEYYRRYVDQVPDGDVLTLLEGQVHETSRLLAGAPSALGNFRYGPDKWSVKEVVGHVIDTERVFAYRALTFARGDGGPLPGFEQDDFVPNSGAERRSLADLVEELRLLRSANVLMFRGFPNDAWARTGIASGYSFTVRTFPYLIAGHERHHRAVLVERYLRPHGLG